MTSMCGAQKKWESSLQTKAKGGVKKIKDVGKLKLLHQKMELILSFPTVQESAQSEQYEESYACFRI